MSHQHGEHPVADHGAAKPLRQEQEPADKQVAELAPGLYRMQLPISMPGLGHVNCYALEDERGLALVDPGLPGEESWSALNQRLGQIGARFDHVHTAVVTHSHPDHFGGVNRLRAEHDIEVLTHADFSSAYGMDSIDELTKDPEIAALDLEDDEDLAAFQERLRRPTPWGTWRDGPPADEMRRWAAMEKAGGPMSFRLPDPSIGGAAGLEVTLGGRTWLAVHTPGHTHDHLCLYDPNDGLFLSGDHVLPTITPHIGGIAQMYDPLAVFFRSLELMHEFSDVSTVLPAHGHPFDDLAGRADDIVHHHEERLDHLRLIGDALGRAPVETFMQHLFKERSWGDMAASETYAHLEHLRILGDADQDEEQGLKRYLVA